MGIAVIPAVVHLSRLAYRTSAAVVQLIDELSLARTGWFFADHASFLSVFQQNALELALRTAYMASVLFLGNILRLPGVICPNCGNFFAMGKETAASCRTCVPGTRQIFGRVMPKPHRMLQPLRPHQPVRIHRRTCRPAPLLKTVRLLRMCYPAGTASEPPQNNLKCARHRCTHFYQTNDNETGYYVWHAVPMYQACRTGVLPTV